MKLLHAYKGLYKTYGEINRYYLYRDKQWLYNPNSYLKSSVVKAKHVMENFEIETSKHLQLDKE